MRHTANTKPTIITNYFNSLTSQMKTSIILNAAFKGNTDAHSVKNHDEAYIAVSNP